MLLWARAATILDSACSRFAAWDTGGTDMRWMLRSKIHKATVTDADLRYVGSITIDEELMDMVEMLPGEKVMVVSKTSGARLET